MPLYALFREGSYRHECGGIFTDKYLAKEAIDILISSEPDKHHTWVCVPFEKNKITEIIPGNGLWFNYYVKEPDPIKL